MNRQEEIKTLLAKLTYDLNSITEETRFSNNLNKLIESSKKIISISDNIKKYLIELNKL